MPKGMQRDPLGDPGRLGGGVSGAVELALGQWVDGVLAREQPAVGQHLAAREGHARSTSSRVDESSA